MLDIDGPRDLIGTSILGGACWSVNAPATPLLRVEGSGVRFHSPVSAGIVALAE
jgi:hypothetical protein